MTKKASTMKVAVQKGPIDASPMTMKTMTYGQKVTEGKQRHEGIKGMQTCKLKEPKR